MPFMKQAPALSIARLPFFIFFFRLLFSHLCKRIISITIAVTCTSPGSPFPPFSPQLSKLYSESLSPAVSPSYSQIVFTTFTDIIALLKLFLSSPPMHGCIWDLSLNYYFTVSLVSPTQVTIVLLL